MLAVILDNCHSVLCMCSIFQMQSSDMGPLLFYCNEQSCSSTHWWPSKQCYLYTIRLMQLFTNQNTVMALNKYMDWNKVFQWTTDQFCYSKHIAVLKWNASLSLIVKLWLYNFRTQSSCIITQYHDQIHTCVHVFLQCLASWHANDQNFNFIADIATHW